MKIICDGADLSDAVLKVSKGTSNKTTNPILEGIKVVAEEDYVTLTATDSVSRFVSVIVTDGITSPL